MWPFPYGDWLPNISLEICVFFIYDDMNYYQAISCHLLFLRNFEKDESSVSFWYNMGLKELCFYQLPLHLRNLYNLFAALTLYHILNVIMLTSQLFCKHSMLTHQIGNDQKAWEYTVCENKRKQSLTHGQRDCKLIGHSVQEFGNIYQTTYASYHGLRCPTSQNIPQR